MSTLPNLVTLSRLIAVPLIVWLIDTGQLATAFWVFVLAGISDGVDGFLAKRLKAESELGAYLDPIADKALLVSVYIALGMQQLLPSWVVILVVSRDILIIGAVLLSRLIGHPLKMQPLPISKLNTTVQIALAALVMSASALGFQDAMVVTGGIILVGVTTVLSGAGYLIQWNKSVIEWERPDGD